MQAPPTALEPTLGELVPYRPAKNREGTTAFLGMVIFLGSWAMMFAALFFSYAFVRAKSEVWPPPDLPELPLLLPSVNTALLFVSSAALQYGLFSVRRAKPRVLGPAVLSTMLLGAVFLGLQLWVWKGLYAEGLRPDTGGPYASVFYGLTWFHALHVAVGLLGLGLLLRRAFAGQFNAGNHVPVRLWAMYWHFVGIVWALMFVSIFLM